jgi:hypothetical protein
VLSIGRCLGTRARERDNAYFLITKM